MVIRVERLHKMMEGEYTCRLRGVMKYSDQRECMNIIKIYEQRIREVLGFYVFRDVGNEIDLLLISSSGTCAIFIHVRTSNDYFDNRAKNQFKNKGNAG